MNPMKTYRNLLLFVVVLAIVISSTAPKKQAARTTPAVPKAPVAVTVVRKPTPAPTIELIVFTAEWCAPCRRAQPVVDEIARTVKGIKVTRVDIDEQSELTEKYGIAVIPTYILCRDGKETLRTHVIDAVKTALETE